jgi:S-adenosylmethionine hydrolase
VDEFVEMNMPLRIVPVTDCVDVAAGELRAALLRAGASASEIEPVVGVEPLSVVNAAFVTRLLAEAYGPGHLLFVVVNPARAQPARVIGRTRNGVFFAGRNNGAFGWLAEDRGIAEVIELPDPGFIAFGGKSIYPPSVVRAAHGESLAAIGSAMQSDAVADCDRSVGLVVHVDNFGIVKIRGYLERDVINRCAGQTFTININGRRICDAILQPRLMSAPDGTWVISPGSSLGGMLELGRARASAAASAGILIGDRLEVCGLPLSAQP